MRDNQIDIAKGIGILLMCIGHSYCPLFMSNFICMFHMAFFFIVSGWFFNYNSLQDPKLFVYKRLKSLWWPFYSWGIIFVLLHNVFNNWGLLSPGASYEYSIKEITWKILTTQPRFIPTEDMQRPYWFLSGLFFCSVYSYLIFYCSNLFKNKQRVAIILFALSYIVGFAFYYAGIEWGRMTLITSFLYFIGYRLHQRYDLIKKNASVLIVASFIILCFCCYMGRINISIGGGKFENPFLFVLYSICGCLLLLGIAIFMNKSIILRKIFAYIGKNSISILLMNYFILAVIHKIRYLFYVDVVPAQNSVYTLHCEWYTEYYAWYWWIIYSILMVVIPLICSLLYQKSLTIIKNI